MTWETFIPAVSFSAPFILYFLKKHGDTEEMKRELSRILLMEIRHNSDLSVDADETPQGDLISSFHTNVYNGIVQSTHIRYFEQTLQSEIHDLYYDIGVHNPRSIEYLEPLIRSLIDMYDNHPRMHHRIKKILEKIFETKYKKFLNDCV